MTSPEVNTNTVPKIVADFEFEGYTFLVVLWPEDMKEDRWQVYLSNFPWYWKTQPYEDVRS